MAEVGQLANDANTPTYPALTTTFTPLPECSSWYLQYCNPSGCVAEAFPERTQLCGSYGPDAMNSAACYPATTTTRQTGILDSLPSVLSYGEYTYSPGLYCPVGMSTAPSVPLLNGVFCCPSGIMFSQEDFGVVCIREETEGTFIMADCTLTTITKPTGSLTTTITITAHPVFLGGQKILNPSSPPTSFLSNSSSGSIVPTSSVPTTPSSGHDDARSSIGLKVGLGVGITLGVILLLALCAFVYVRGYRKRMARKQTPRSDTSADIFHIDKPELPGCTFQGAYAKAELDSTAARAELEAPLEENGAGIFVHKAELQGTDGRSVSGVYVKRKGELEAGTTGNGSSKIASSE